MRYYWRLVGHCAVKALKEQPELTENELITLIAEKMKYNFDKQTTAVAREARVRKILGTYQVTEAVRRAIAKYADFSPDDAYRKLVEHIQGEDSNLSMRALDKYFMLTHERPAKNVNVEQKTLVARIDVKDAAPPIQARILDALPRGKDGV